MKWNKLYKYPNSTKSLIEGNRHYDVSNEVLPSVTTILQATQSEEKSENELAVEVDTAVNAGFSQFLP